MNPALVSASGFGLLTTIVITAVAPGVMAAGAKDFANDGGGLMTVMSSFGVEAAT
mgnify:CR=1 FL=1